MTITYELIQGTLKGDKQAADELIRLLTRVFERECSFAVHFAKGNREDVQQLVHDLFVDLFADEAKALRRYDPEKGSSPEGYFRRFARFRCANWRRAQRFARRAELLSPEDLTDLIDHAPQHEDVSDLGAALEQSETLRRIAAVLTPEEFDLFQRRYLQFQSGAELSQHFGISQEALYKRLSRLVAILRNEGFFDSLDQRKGGEEDMPAKD